MVSAGKYLFGVFRFRFAIVGTAALIFGCAFAAAQRPRQAGDPSRQGISEAHAAPAILPSAWTVAALENYDVTPNITYLTADGFDLHLDIFAPIAANTHPTIVHFHPGGWVGFNKESELLALLPFLQLGWTVVNVEYRLNSQSLAPGAIEDARCAVRWLIEHSPQYHIDPGRIVLSGRSAGAHLALMAGLAEADSGFDFRCGAIASDDFQAAAIVSWFAITDVEELVRPGTAYQAFAAAWLGSGPDRLELAKRVSPLNHISPDDPPVISVHGSNDRVIPYSQAVRLHQALDTAGVRNRLYTVAGGGHAGFSPEQSAGAYEAIFSFLADAGLE